MAEAEAEDIMETDTRLKDFWTVDFDYDNCSKLQEAIEGNKYEVDYQNNQNGTRLIIHCQLRQQIITPKDPNIKGTLRRQPHNVQRGIFPEGSLEDKIDSCSEPILGVHFVYKEVIAGIETYTCHLCQKDTDVTRIRSSKMLSHLISKAHNKKYMEVKFGYLKKSYSDYEDEAMQIEKFEGKIHTSIIDFTKQLPLDLINQSSANMTYVHYNRHNPIGNKLKLSRSVSNSPSRSRRSRSSSHSSYSRSPSRNRRSRSPSRNRRSRSPSRNRRSRSPSLSRRSRSPSRNRRSKSPSRNRRSKSPSRNRHSKSPSRSRRSRSPSQSKYSRSQSLHNCKSTSPECVDQVVIPPEPTKPLMCEVAVTTDMSQYPNHILKEVNLLKEASCQELLQEDTDMQGLLIQTLWVLNLKLEKYYLRSNRMYTCSEGTFPLTQVSVKVKEKIAQLDVIPPIQHDNDE
ncbi:Transcription elongation factor SPT5-like 4 [Homarus americanus]|uniref:Transcription elongation factor SPT5-like 4 n=1 Tax=Homarus americanus TaxID=6706 RepID=A0A8J5MMK7_HOMAM|nr:Transcription elongation factor SPT5-like 4 [Homarus americanus]